ncbi:MAG: glycosyltransferase [Bacteroidales bacterium]
MKLTVVIVNYNVKHFLTQCLLSVQKAMQGLEAEVFVVDNNSVDGSVAEIRERFPWVALIPNRENLGFSKANNQAIRRAAGEFILLLNPDTVVEEDTFTRCLAYLDAHPEAGALGVRMIDGKGRFLPESKRALPTLRVAFYKMSGLSRLFPRSREFARYHLGHLDEHRTHRVEVLAGAFMMLRKEALDKTGLLDEDYFMYGEDIDLSHRIRLAGYENCYFPDTTIIHYKGESTKKGSLNYVRLFYQAMIIFAEKHLAPRKAKSFGTLIRMAIYFRAALSLLRRFARSLFRPLLDAAAIYGGYALGLPLWEQVRFHAPGYYPPLVMQAVVPAYLTLWIGSLYFSGGYDRPLRISSFLRGYGAGTLLILVIYALLPVDLRFSRALIFLGATWAVLVTLGYRLLFHALGWKSFAIARKRSKRMVILGSPEEARRVSRLLGESMAQPRVLGFVVPDGDGESPDCLGHVGQIEEIVKVHRVEELVFCSRDLTSRTIIRIMSLWTEGSPDFKIAPPESLSIIGSNSIHTAGDLYTIPVDTVGNAANRRYKRFFDATSGLLLLATFPVWILWVRGHVRSLGHVFQVLAGTRTWVVSGGTGRHRRIAPPAQRNLSCRPAPGDGGPGRGICGPGEHDVRQRLPFASGSVDNRAEFQGPINQEIV